MEIGNFKNEKHTTYFLIGSFTSFLLISVTAFLLLSRYVSSESEKSIHTVGDLYMTGINNHITAHFRTLIDLKLEQAQAIVEVVPAEMEDQDALYEELVYRSSVRSFNYLALCSQDGRLEMLDGSDLYLADPDSFFESLRRGEKKVAVGYDANGAEVILFGISADYPLRNGEKCMALVTAVSIDYISAMLGTDEENALIFSYIIRKDGTFIISDTDTGYKDYFESLYARFPASDGPKIDTYIQELTAAMEKKENYATILDLDHSSQQIYSNALPYSEWHLVTVLPFGALNETVETLNRNRSFATLLVGAVIISVLLVIFYLYFRMTCKQLHDLDTARKEALAATKAKSLFLSNMSHDIRTPMNAIVGMTAIATTHINDREQVMNCLRKITLSGKHLLGLINDVLDMSKIESGKMTLTMERVSLQEVIEGIVGIVQTQVKGRNQNFNVHIDNILAENVYCDSIRLNQILLNLLSNAVKYTQEKGTIELSLFQENDPPEKGDSYVRTHIMVKDNGVGMSQEFLSQVFESYTREDSLRVHKTEGAGLGMAITKYIIDVMGGSITVESKLHEGTRFHVTLDLEKADSQEVDMVLPPWKMLVVDDDETLCRTAVESLKSIGIQADWTLSGEKAISIVSKHHQTRDDYQIVMLDWKLPGMDGLSVAKQIRQIVGADMPIILISAYDWSDFENEAKEAGIDGFIAKPLFKSTLFYGLKKYMNVDETPDKPCDQDQLAGLHVLVAEDNDLNWEILQALLTDIEMKPDWAENGQLCLEKFQASEPGYYDIILMDVRMPVMNGYEATKAIRACGHPDAQKIPIIAMTADAFSEDIKKCLDCGMNAHTAKPINFEEVIALLKKYIFHS